MPSNTDQGDGQGTDPGDARSTDPGDARGANPHRRQLIWDWPTRLFHWLLALCLVGSWITAKGFDWLDWHMRIGYLTLGLLAFRLAWGVVGPRHARFASFIKGPRATLAYLRTLPTRHAGTQAAGHNPLGALAVLAMLTLLLLQAVTGLFATDELLHLGPYNGAVDGATGERLTTVHKTNANLVFAAVGLHLVAIVFYALYKRQNLVGPMITGRRRVLVGREAAGEAIASPRSLLALVLVASVAAGIWLLLALAPPPPAPDFF